jgi:hypothetical protein
MRAPGGVQAAANIAGVDRDSDRYLTAIMPTAMAPASPQKMNG